MRTTTSNDITGTETLNDADLQQVAGGFCATPPVIGLPVFPPIILPWPPKRPGPGPDPVPPRLPSLPTLPTWPSKDAESMLPDLLWAAK
jgi:hypothetical protein